MVRFGATACVLPGELGQVELVDDFDDEAGQGEFAPSGLDPESMELGPTGGQRREFPV
jgi:hypothetical protein